MVSFFSPYRYIVDSFVRATNESLLAFAFAFSFLLMKVGELSYIPSKNLAPSLEDVDLAIIPHEVSEIIAPKISM